MRNKRERGPPRGGLIRKGIQGLSAGVGLASESIKAHKEGRAQEREAISRTTSEASSRSGDNYQPPSGPPPSYSPAQASSTGLDEYADEKPGDFKQPAEIEEDNLEDEWALDDAQEEAYHTSSEKAPAYDSIFAPISGQAPPDKTEAEKLEDTFLRNHGIPRELQGPSTSVGRLPLTVVLPQRRPKDRSRGFIRAYAPVLENCGIDQATWLQFLDTFQKSSAANPWLNAINMAQFATFALPTPIGLAVGYAISQITNAAIELQSRERTNKFLYKINEEFFRPRGLYCLVMTWNPNTNQRMQQVDITSSVASRSNDGPGLGVNSFRSSDGKTYGEWEFPETAPLVFPALDQLASQTDAEGEKKQSAMAKKMKFAAEYWDKRATAEYAMQNPDSVLANVPQGEFKSRYADPKSHAASGSLIAFVSGGHLVPNPESRGLVGGLLNVAGQAIRGEKQGSGWDRTNARNQEQQAAMKYYREHQKEQYQQDPNHPYPNQQYGYGTHQNVYGRDYQGRGYGRKKVVGPVGAFKRLLRKDVLYLMVVNMPSDEEIAQARTMFG